MQRQDFGPKALASALAVVVALAACSPADRSATTDTAGGVAARTDTSAAGGVVTSDTSAAARVGEPGATVGGPRDDASIFAHLAAADSAEIATSRIAQTKATNAQVKAFARKMVNEHSAMSKETAALAKRLNVTPATRDSGLIKDANDWVKDLREKEAGKEFDGEYLDKQIDAHQKALDVIDDALKTTQNPQLRDALTKARPKVEAHLNEAKRIKEAVN